MKINWTVSSHKNKITIKSDMRLVFKTYHVDEDDVPFNFACLVYYHFKAERKSFFKKHNIKIRIVENMKKKVYIEGSQEFAMAIQDFLNESEAQYQTFCILCDRKVNKNK